MQQYDIRRDLIVRAFERALAGEKAGLIDITSMTGMNVDMAYVLLRKTEILRDDEGRGGGEQLRRLVKRACRSSGLPNERCYAYEVIAMNYYGILKEFADARRQRKSAEETVAVADELFE